MKMNHRGFTLIELLVVLAILMALSGSLLPVILSAREKGRESYCANNLKQLYQTLDIYAQNWDGSFPPEYLADAVQADYVSRSILTCLSDDPSVRYGQGGGIPEGKRTSYDWAGPYLNFSGGGKWGDAYADRIAYMQMNHPSYCLIACGYHGYQQNEVGGGARKLLRLAFDGSIKTAILPPSPRNPNGHMIWSIFETLGWNYLIVSKKG